jgi:diguanylate cyclase (GGDEF)-like protein
MIPLLAQSASLSPSLFMGVAIAALAFSTSALVFRLRKARLIYHQALDHMSQGLAMFDRDGRLLLWNRRYETLFNLSPGDLIAGMPLRQLLEARQRRGSFSPSIEPSTQAFVGAAARGESFRQKVEINDAMIVSSILEPIEQGGWVTTHEDVTELDRAQARIVEMAFTDALTGLPTRGVMMERLRQALARRGKGGRIALLLVDVDNFRDINETFGNVIGDEALCAVAERLRAIIGPSDCAARLYGDQFVVMRETDGDEPAVTRLAETIASAFRAPIFCRDHLFNISVGIGIAVADDPAVDAEQLMKHADFALRDGKGDGSGARRLFGREMNVMMRERSTLRRELTRALERRELEVHFQPLINLADSQVCGFEALLRWRHPMRGLVPPSEFIPIAEESGMIAPIGEWVLEESCRLAAGWPEHIRICVNLSPAQLKHSNLVLAVMRALSAARLAPHRLELEITETVLLQDNREVTTALSELKSIGVHLALDDFGTGYSSLSYLRRYKFDTIKIDRSFIADVAGVEDPSSHMLVRAIARLGVDLHVEVVAEGIETKEQLDIVTQEGVPLGQGHFFSPALTAAGVDRLLARQAALAIAS